MRHLLRHDIPGETPMTSWAAVVRRNDGSVVAAVSPQFRGGLYQAWDAGQPVFSDLIRDVVTPDTLLDADYLRAYAALAAPAHHTPFAGIRRIVAGTTAIWHRGHRQPRVVEWCGPHSWALIRPDLDDAVDLYRSTFDQALKAVTPADGPLVATLSGGLDSSFVVASLARRTTPDRPVTALCHSPRPDARLRSAGAIDPDDYEVAESMERAFPGRVRVERVVSELADQPLDAAALASALSGLPTFNPGNQIWISRMTQMAADVGAQALFTGQHGNAAFSLDHSYAVRHYLRAARPAAMWQAVVAHPHDSVRATLRHELLGPLSAPLRERRRTDRFQSYLEPLGLAGRVRPQERLLGRPGFLEFLSTGGAYAAPSGPRCTPVPHLDPFTNRSLLDLAARIEPLEWQRGPATRGFARRVGADRVPDSFRLRRRRGGQSWDEWFLIHNQRDRYLDEVDLIPATPILQDWLDHRTLRRTVLGLPWGHVESPDRATVLGVNRTLALAAYIRTQTQWLRTLGRPDS